MLGRRRRERQRRRVRYASHAGRREGSSARRTGRLRPEIGCEPLTRSARRGCDDEGERVERNGEVSYRWHDGGEAFRDRGPEITFCDTSDASIAAGLELARAKWGNEVTLHGSADFKERALRLAVERGIHVNNPELQVRQRELVVERERARSQDRELLRERSRDRGI